MVGPYVAHLRYRPELRPLDLVDKVGELVRAGLEPRLRYGRLDLRKGTPTFSWISAMNSELNRTFISRSLVPLFSRFFTLIIFSF